MIEMTKKRMEVDDAEAIYTLGCCYYNGRRGLPQDLDKALELWHRAGELGSVESYITILVMLMIVTRVCKGIRKRPYITGS